MLIPIAEDNVALEREENEQTDKEQA